MFVTKIFFKKYNIYNLSVKILVNIEGKYIKSSNKAHKYVKNE